MRRLRLAWEDVGQWGQGFRRRRIVSTDNSRRTGDRDGRPGRVSPAFGSVPGWHGCAAASSGTPLLWTGSYGQRHPYQHLALRGQLQQALGHPPGGAYAAKAGSTSAWGSRRYAAWS